MLTKKIIINVKNTRIHYIFKNIQNIIGPNLMAGIAQKSLSLIFIVVPQKLCWGFKNYKKKKKKKNSTCLLMFFRTFTSKILSYVFF